MRQERRLRSAHTVSEKVSVDRVVGVHVLGECTLKLGDL